jgi:hypothetical protein
VRRARFTLGLLLMLPLVAACGGHHHGPNRADDRRYLYVEVFADHDALHHGAMIALQRIHYVVTANHNGDLELQVEAPQLDSARGQTICRVKILALRLPQHDLLAVADASGRATGTGRTAEQQCLATTTQTLVRGKVRALLDRRLRDKR